MLSFSASACPHWHLQMVSYSVCQHALYNYSCRYGAQSIRLLPGQQRTQDSSSAHERAWEERQGRRTAPQHLTPRHRDHLSWWVHLRVLTASPPVYWVNSKTPLLTNTPSTIHRRNSVKHFTTQYYNGLEIYEHTIILWHFPSAICLRQSRCRL